MFDHQSRLRVTMKALPCLAGMILALPFAAPPVWAYGLSDLPRSSAARALPRPFFCASRLAGPFACGSLTLPGRTSPSPVAFITACVFPSKVQSSSCSCERVGV